MFLQNRIRIRPRHKAKGTTNQKGRADREIMQLKIGRTFNSPLSLDYFFLISFRTNIESRVCQPFTLRIFILCIVCIHRMYYNMRKSIICHISNRSIAIKSSKTLFTSLSLDDILFLSFWNNQSPGFLQSYRTIDNLPQRETKNISISFFFKKGLFPLDQCMLSFSHDLDRSRNANILGI